MHFQNIHKPYFKIDYNARWLKKILFYMVSYEPVVLWTNFCEAISSAFI